MTIPSVEEVRRAAPEFRAFVGLAAFAGLRLGEAAGVQVGDIDFLRRTLDVRRQVQGATRKTATITRPKYGSERTVPIPTHLVTLLAQHVETIGTQGEERWLFFRGSDRIKVKSAEVVYLPFDKTSSMTVSGTGTGPMVRLAHATS